MCEECPLGLNAFLSTRPPKGLIPNKSDGELYEIMIKSRGHSVHTGHGIEPTVTVTSHEVVSLIQTGKCLVCRFLYYLHHANGVPTLTLTRKNR